MSGTDHGQIRRAARLILVTRFWGFAAAPISLLVNTHSLSQEAQGYFYSFYALVAASVLVELGLSQVLMTISSHHRHDLVSFNRHGMEGDAETLDRLGWLLSRATIWMATGAPLFVILIGSLGAWCLSGHTGDVVWWGPWIAVVLLAVPGLLVAPVVAILEGCGLVADVACLRLAQVVLPAIAMWLSLLNGAMLWAPAIGSATGGVLAFVFLFRYRHLCLSLWRRMKPANVRWSSEVWPLQWRYGISWLCGWFMSQYLVPLVLRVDGPVHAGQLGISINLAWTLIGIGSVWINAANPELGRLAAGRQWAAMDVIWKKAIVRGMLVSLFGACSVMVGLEVLHVLWPKLAIRFLSPGLLAWVLVYALAHVFISGVAVHLRAHRSEPFLILSIVEGVAIAGFATVCVVPFGVAGVVVSQAIIHLAIGLGGALFLRHHFLPKFRMSSL